MGDSLAARLFALADAQPGRVLVHFLRGDAKGVFRDEPLTAGEWKHGALACALALQRQGLKRGDRVLICMRTSRAFLEAFLGTQALGMVPVPLPSLEGFARPAAFVKRLNSVVQDAAPSAMFADRRTALHLRQSGLLGQTLPVIEPAPASDGPLPEPAPASGDDTALIQYTSGSTGVPRGVVITAANLVANATAMGKAVAITADDRVVSWLPLYHDMGLIGGLLMPIAHGAACWLLSPLEFMVRPASWMQAVSQVRATFTVAPNFAYGLVARRVSDDALRGLELASLRAAVNGAESVDPGTAEAFCRRLAPMGFRPSAYFPVYGLAESTLAVAFSPIGRGVKVDVIRRDELANGRATPAQPGPDAMQVVSVGPPIEGHEVIVVDPATHVPLGERRLGEIWVTGPSISPFYFEGHQKARSRRKSLRTGDVGYLADGELYVVDRLKDLVIVAGRCYAPSDIERAAERTDGVRSGRSVAFGVADPESGTEALVVLAEVRPKSLPELQALAAAIAERVTDEIGLAPADVLLLRPGALARTSSGKLMRRDARDRYVAGKLEGERAARPALSRRLLHAFRRFVARAKVAGF